MTEPTTQAPTQELYRCNICGFMIDAQYAAEKPTAEFDMRGRKSRPTPSPRLDAGTVERCAQIVEADKCGWYECSIRIAASIRALLTDATPQQCAHKAWYFKRKGERYCFHCHTKLDANPHSPRPRWRHVKRGSIVTEIGRGFAQVAAHPIEEMSAVVVYEHDGKIWVRNAVEFDDGRFVAVEDTTPHSPPPAGEIDAAIERLRERARYEASSNNAATESDRFRAEDCLAWQDAELFAALRSCPSEGRWRTMESAPRDGTHVLVAFASHAVEAWWHIGSGLANGFWKPADALRWPINTFKPTHWRPLPSPPATDKEQGA